MSRTGRNGYLDWRQQGVQRGSDIVGTLIEDDQYRRNPDALIVQVEPSVRNYNEMLLEALRSEDALPWVDRLIAVGANNLNEAARVAIDVQEEDYLNHLLRAGANDFNGLSRYARERITNPDKLERIIQKLRVLGARNGNGNGRPLSPRRNGNGLRNGNGRPLSPRRNGNGRPLSPWRFNGNGSRNGNGQML